MKQNKFDRLEKELLALKKRYDEVLSEKRKTKWKKLEKPVQDGWVISISLREDALRRNDAPAMLECLSLCATTFQTRNSKLVSLVRKTKSFDEATKHFYGKSYYSFRYYSGPVLQKISKKQYDSLSEAVKKWFEIHSETSKWGGATIYSAHCNIPRYYLVLKVSPRMVNYISEVDPEKESEYKWLSTKLEQVQAWVKLYGKSWRDDYPKQSIRTTIRAQKNKFLKGEIDDIVADKKKHI